MIKKSAFALLFFILVIAAVALSQTEGAKSFEEGIAQAENLWLQGKYDDGDAVLDGLIKQYPDKGDPYWRKARNLYDRLEDLPRDKKPDKNTLIKKYREVEKLGQTCIDKEPKNGACYQWKGIGLGRRGTTQGILASLDEAKDLEQVFLKGIEVKSDYRAENGSGNAMGDMYTAIGQFYRVVPEWLCSFPFKQLIGTCGSLEKSVDYQRKAVEREPKRIEYVKELGVSLICFGEQKKQPDKVEEGKKVLGQVASLPDLKPQDKIDKEHSKMLIDNPKLACGYSRDAQQEQSKEAYDKDKK